jgi:hypothetical protein
MKRQLLLLPIIAAVLLTNVATQTVWSEAHIPEGKVQICHKGKKTLSIHPDSVTDHFLHGDDVSGPC